jgi:hypothetical protein
MCPFIALSSSLGLPDNQDTVFCKFFNPWKKNSVKSPLRRFLKVLFEDKKTPGENSRSEVQ